jgi:hypothetical protein
MKYNLICSYFGTSGYSIHSQMLFKSLNKIADVRIECALPNNWCSLVDDQELIAIKKEDDKERTNIILTNPIYWKMYATKKINFAYLVWEGDKVPECFIEECLNENITKIIVPSQHTYDAIMNTIFARDEKTDWMDKVVIIPHGIDTELFYPKRKDI